MSTEVSSESTVIARIPKGEHAEIRITISTYNDRRFLHIREYQKTEAGDFTPTKKGTALWLEDAPKLVAGIKKLEEFLAAEKGGDWS